MRSAGRSSAFWLAGLFSLLLGVLFLVYFPSGTTLEIELVHGLIALSLAILPFAAVWLRYRDSLHLGAYGNDHAGGEPGAWPLYVCCALLVLAVAWMLQTGSQLDYTDYLNHWRALLDGDDPWMQDRGESRNAYGPLHLLFAPMVWVHPLLPKVVSGLLVFGAATLIGRDILRQGRTSGEIMPALAVMALLTVLSPFMWASVFHRGHNDILTAALILLAFSCNMREKLGLAGFFLGIAILHKYYPILLLPFLAVTQRGIWLRTPVVCFIVVAIGLGISFLIWGNDSLGPLLYSQDRPPKLLSIFRVTLAYPSIPEMIIGIRDASVLSTPLMLAVGGTIALYVYYFRIPALLGAITGLLAMFTFYKVGHQQFYISYFLLLALATIHWADDRYRRTVIYSIPFVAFVTAFDVYFDLSYRAEPYPFMPGLVRYHIGIPAFLISVPTIIAGLVVAGRKRRERLIELRW